MSPLTGYPRTPVSSALPQSDTILVADDSMTILAMVSSRLERAGYDVVTATRGDDALRLVQENRPRLVLLDVEMPGLDGVEVTRRIRADEALAETFIVLLTSLSTRRARSRREWPPAPTPTSPSRSARRICRRRSSADRRGRAPS